VSVTPGVEIATMADIAALGELRVAEGWHASQDLLGALVAWENGYIGLIREAALDPHSTTPDRIIATTSAIAADMVGVIGNVVVHPEFRRKGLGRVIMNAALGWLRARGVRTVLLDATKEGRPLYTQLGFSPLASSWWINEPLARLDQARLQQIAGTAIQAQVYDASALSHVAALDAVAFGGDRMGLLAATLHHPHNWLAIATDAQNAVVGYLICGRLRKPTHSIHLGPLVARDQATAAALLTTLAREDAPWRAALDDADVADISIRCSVPGIVPDVLSFYRTLGLTPIEDDTLMQLDFTNDGDSQKERLPYPGNPSQVYAWLAPMVF